MNPIGGVWAESGAERRKALSSSRTVVLLVMLSSLSNGFGLKLPHQHADPERTLQDVCSRTCAVYADSFKPLLDVPRLSVSFHEAIVDQPEKSLA